MKIKSKKRTFENKKTELRTWALELWRQGQTIAEIAKQTQKTRATIYRWVRRIDAHLKKEQPRTRMVIDSQSVHRVIEIFILLKRPSMEILSKELKKNFHIDLASHQLRYLLKRLGLIEYKPSGMYDLIFQQSAFERRVPNSELGDL